MKKTICTPAMFCSRLHDLQRYQGFIRSACNRYVQNPVEAEDLAQEVLLKAAGRLDGFCGDSGISTWLYRIAFNHAMDHLRRQRRRIAAMEAYSAERSAEPASGEADEAEPLPPSLLDRLRERLGEADWHLVYLRFHLGLTLAGIGGILGVSRTAVAKRLAKIRSKAMELRETGLVDLAAT